MELTSGTATLPAIRTDLAAGVDVGGTKVHIVDTDSDRLYRYHTGEYDSMDAVLEQYFREVGARPARITVGMAGPRDDDTGEVKLTNAEWATFYPQAAGEKYGITCYTANDLVATTVGVLADGDAHVEVLKPGVPQRTGTKLVVAISTGIGGAAAVWDHFGERYVVTAGECGHIGFQPKTPMEQQYLEFLLDKYPHASAELALSGKYGIYHLADFVLSRQPHEKLGHDIDTARRTNGATGSLLLEYAGGDESDDQQAAQQILSLMGAMVGGVIRDLTVAFKATGGVYLTGSAALVLGQYFAEHTDFSKRFVCRGAVHDTWIDKIPLTMVTEPNIAVYGALELAKQL